MTINAVSVDVVDVIVMSVAAIMLLLPVVLIVVDYVRDGKEVR